MLWEQEVAGSNPASPTDGPAVGKASRRVVDSCPMGILYVFAGFLAVPGVLFLFARLSRRPDLDDPLAPFQPHKVGDEAEQWLKSQP